MDLESRLRYEDEKPDRQVKTHVRKLQFVSDLKTDCLPSLWDSMKNIHMCLLICVL